MILTGDYHIHTPYSHGKNTVLENALKAKELGIKEIAITDHGFNHVLFGLRRKKVDKLREEIEFAKKETGVNVLMGVESNVTSNDGATDFLPSDMAKFDVYLCGMHEVLWFKNLSNAYNLFFKNYVAYLRGKKPSQKIIDNTTKAYINVIKKNPVDVITHINYKCCCDVVEVAKCCADYGTYIEINTKKHHISPEELNAMAQTGVRFLINSDAHAIDRVGDTKIAEELLSDANISLDLIDNIDGRTPNFRFAQYKKENL